ncbi:hypothetical protein ABZ897_48845 [Nonomuraea sp. NPDC046802]|uniref:hypothetical protein n=1 Tax=Nonomuraea sp. NPDC046802 TaxID=3154919 RepID=UPI0034056D28
MSGSLEDFGLPAVGLLAGAACFLAGSVGNGSTFLVPSRAFAVGLLLGAAVFLGFAEGGAGKVTYAAGDSPDPIDPPSPSPLNALTVNPTFCPATFAGTESTALHEEPEQALSAAILPTMPD